MVASLLDAQACGVVPGSERGSLGNDCGSGIATGRDSASGSGRGSWWGGHGPCTGCPATLRYSMISGQAHMVGLFPVLGAPSISSKRRGLPRLWPEDSNAKGTSSNAALSTPPTTRAAIEISIPRWDRARQGQRPDNRLTRKRAVRHVCNGLRSAHHGQYECGEVSVPSKIGRLTCRSFQ